jgi:hypothetical protein
MKKPITKKLWDTRFIPEVRTRTGGYILVVSTSLRHSKAPLTSVVLNDTRNILELLLALHRGKHKNLLQSPGGGQEQSPSLPNASNKLQAA